MQSLTHFEVFGRRSGGVLNLEYSLENQENAVKLANDMLASREFVAIKVTRETRDPETGEFTSSVIRKEGDFSAAAPKRPNPGVSAPPTCEAATDLYGPQARVKIAEFLEGWLGRKSVTAFELLHRLDLADSLCNSGSEFQHAIQKFAVPESLARGSSVHEVIRSLHPLIDQAASRLRAATKAQQFPLVAPSDFAAACDALAEHDERLFLLAGAVAADMALAADWSEKLDRLLALAEAAPEAGRGRDLAFHVLAQPLGEMLSTAKVMNDVLGEELDLGARLAATAQLMAPAAITTVAQIDPTAAALIPPATPTAVRIGKLLADSRMGVLYGLIGKRILAEISSQKRLRPTDAGQEVEILRALATTLTVAADKQMTSEAVRDAFIARSAAMVGTEFVTAYLKTTRSAVQEALALTRLLESVVGGAHKRQAVCWLQSTVTSLRFETAINAPGVPAYERLTQLAVLYRRVARTGKDAAGVEPLLQTLGELGGKVEAETRLIASLNKGLTPAVQKLQVLIRMAAGESAPPGPAAERARREANRVMTQPETTEELSREPKALHQIQTLIRALDKAP